MLVMATFLDKMSGPLSISNPLLFSFPRFVALPVRPLLSDISVNTVRECAMFHLHLLNIATLAVIFSFSDF